MFGYCKRNQSYVNANKAKKPPIEHIALSAVTVI